MTRVAGIVLCGGRSSRMGRPKAWLPFGDEVLLQRVVRILGEVVAPIVVVAAPEQALPKLSSQTLIARDDCEFLGPLSGLATGLAALDGLANVAYLSSCDVPLLRPAFVRRVLAGLGEAAICMPDVVGFKHPLAAAYRVSVAATVHELIRANRLRPVFLTESLTSIFLKEADLLDLDPQFESLRNLNTPEEYAAALVAAGYAPTVPD
jgi:molybdenum cofactor guanylyltransferase